MSSDRQSPDIRGDFQTPVQLARRVWEALDLSDVVGAVVEPTVGCGAFLEAAPDLLLDRPWLCFDIEPAHLDVARLVADKRGLSRARIEHADAFDLSPQHFAQLDQDQPLLAIGNPPWITSAGQGSLESQNLPIKSNARFGLAGLDAMTGKANFDIAEAILLRLLESLAEFRDVRLAFLVKRSVAMKMSRRLLGTADELSFSSIDAATSFGVAVDAGLFVMRRRLATQTTTSCVQISDELGGRPVKRAGFRNNGFVEDLDAHATSAHLEAAEPVPWRQGVKHDLARILELRQGEDGLVNGLGERVEVEVEALCPLYKGSDLAHGRPPRCLLPLYQLDMSGPRPDLSSRWPLLTAYLAQHEDSFNARRSKIYVGKPPFTLFGIGPYALAPWKVAVSGLYPSAIFRVIGPSSSGHPPLVDDTCYLLPFDTEGAARSIADHLNSAGPQDLLRSLMDQGAKRPVTKAVLARIAVPTTSVETVEVAPPSFGLAA